MLGYIFKVKLKKVIFIFLLALFLLYSTKFYLNESVEDMPIIIWWTPFMIENERQLTCGEYECTVTIDRGYINKTELAAYLFYGSDFKVEDLPLPKTEIPWAIYHEESPKNLAFFLYESGQKLFDITSTFSRNSHLPNPLQFLDDINLLSDLKYYVPLSVKNKLNISPVLYIQSDCDTPIERDQYVKELMKYVEVDSYGPCLNNKKLPEEFKLGTFIEVYEENFMNFVAQYKFTIAIENSVCNDYITEKLWRPLIVGSVPIYLGSPTVKDWLPNNNSAILMGNLTTIKELALYIDTLNKNDELYLKYMEHKLAKNKSSRITNKFLKDTMQKKLGYDHSFQAFECFVCKNIYTNEYKRNNIKNSIYECPRPVSSSTEKNWWIDHWDLGKCEAKTLQYFINELKLYSFSKDTFAKQRIKFYLDNDC